MQPSPKPIASPPTQRATTLTSLRKSVAAVQRSTTPKPSDTSVTPLVLDGLSYVVLTAPKKQPAVLANKVSMLMADGWWVQGGVSISGQLLYQSMSKRAAVTGGNSRVATVETGDWVEPA